MLRDPVSSLTHLLTGIFAVYVTLLLCRLAGGDRTKRLSLLCFGASMMLLYTASGIYHAIPLPKTSPTVEFFRRLDHSAIYVLIAGTYTPVFAVLLHGRKRTIMLSVVWSLAAAGIACKWLLPMSVEWLSAVLYVAMGWLSVVPLSQLFRVIGYRGLGLALAGGLFYTAGAVFDVLRWPVLIPGVFAWHEVFHLCVIAGTAMHVMFMMCCVIPYDRQTIQPVRKPRLRRVA